MAFAGYAATAWLAPGTRHLTQRADGEEVAENQEPAARAGAVGVENAGAQGLRGDAFGLLGEAKKLKDPLSIAAKSIEGIDALTAADFARLVEKGEMPDIMDIRVDAFEELIRGAFIEKWAQVEPGRAMGQMFELAEKLQKKSPGGVAGRLMEIAAKTLPETFLREAFSRTSAGTTLPPPEIKFAFTSLAGRDLGAARRFLEQTPAGYGEAMEKAIGEGMAVSDPLGAMDLARRFRSLEIFHAAVRSAERVGPGMVRKVVEQAGTSLGGWGGSGDAEDFGALVLRYPGALEGVEMPWPFNSPSNVPPPEWLSPDAKLALGKLPREKRAEMLKNPDKIAERVRQAMVAGLVELWVDEEPAAALPWAMEQSAKLNDDEHQWYWGYCALFEWHRQNPAAALAAWNALPEGPGKDSVGRSMVNALAGVREFDSARSYFRANPGYKYEVHEYELFQRLTREDPVKAGDWLLNVPVDWRWDGHLFAVCEALERTGSGALEEWVEALPTPAAQDRAIAAAARAVARTDPEAAAQWIELLDEPAARRAAVEVFASLRAYDPTAGPEWLRLLGNVDPVWRERFLRLAR